VLVSDLAIPANADERAAALVDFGTYLNPQKVRAMRTAGLDLVEGERSGAWVWDVDGRRFLDCFTSAGSFNVGRRHPKVVAAAKEALDHLDHGNFLLCSAQKARLAERLAELSPGNLTCTTFGTGGGEAVDFALKLARGATGRPRVVSTVNGYHGHTGFALSAGGRDAFREPFEPLIPEFVFVPFGDADALRDAVDERTAAVILEPIQGEGGIVVPPDGYLTAAREACDGVGAKLIFDEIQTGMGRTGRWFASQHEGVVPDVMTVAKSLGGSLAAISATIYTEEMREFLIPHPFIHLSTFGGSDLACAIALATLEVIEEEGLVENAAAMGVRLLAGLAELAARHPDMIGETRGRGLMTGVKYREDSHGPRMSYQLSQRGVLAIYSGNEPSVMRLMPSLIVGPDEIDLLLTALDESINAVRAGDGPADEESTRVRRRPQRAAQEG
jgi:acetylornithine/succinyldiaminopimelate/putrescine aminotransferase